MPPRNSSSNEDDSTEDFQDTPGYTDSEINTGPSSVNGDAPVDGRKRRAEASQLRKSIANKKQGKLEESKENDSIRRYRYLLGLTDLFRHFIETNPNPQIRELMEQIDKENADAKNKTTAVSRKGGAGGGKRRRTEKEEDAELLRDGKHVDDEGKFVFRESPSYVHGQLRDYQVAGLNWLISLHENGISGILADEMGLGKTLQTISFIGYLRFFRQITGPHLVAVPKSTLDNWKREFARWIPDINVFVLQGAKEERQQLVKERLIDENFDVCITSYEMILREKAHLRKFAWEYIIVDEAHRIKNEESSLAQIIREFHSRNRLLITGTPLQNNLHELWALLNFLLPDVFGDAAAFDQWFSGSDEDPDQVVQQLHRILQPFLLRRVKSDVEKSLLPKKEMNLYVGMTDMQRKWYRNLLMKDIDAVNNAAGKRESKTRLLNIVMQLRKCCNHPYLFDGAEPGPPYTTDEHLVYNSAKMVLLDKLLVRMKEQGSRVLIFSQMSRVLDIMEDYSVMRGFKYCRIDGSTAHEDRISAIDEYNKEGSEKFLFLLTTRAGGLGINLTTADIVILFDSDWNPQADLQAMDRAHRIGQTKQVKVFRFITEDAVEEKVLERAAQKLRLDQLVIQQGRAQQQAKGSNSKDELLSMIQHGANKVMADHGDRLGTGENGEVTEDDIDAILKKGEERTAELNAKYEKLGIDDLQNFTSDSNYEWNGETFVNKKKDMAFDFIQPQKRERKEQSYSMDKYYRQALMTGGRTADTKPKIPRAPKQVTIHEYQFFPEELDDIQRRETAWYRKENNIKAPLEEGDEDTLEERKARQKEVQEEIDNAEPLAEDELEKKEELINEGFPQWNKRDFQQYINGMARYGRNDFDGIALEVDGKDAAQIKEYSVVFWQKYKTLENWEKHIETIKSGEERRSKVAHQKELLKRKLKQYRAPLLQLKLNYSVSTTNKKVYTEDEDRFLLVWMDKIGIDQENIWERIRDEIRESPLFRFDWFFISRSPVELSRRGATLLTTVQREFEPGAGGDGRVMNGKKRAADAEDDDDDVDDDEEEEDEEPVRKKAKPGPKNKALDNVKGGRSRSNSVASSTSGRGRGKGKVSRK